MICNTPSNKILNDLFSGSKFLALMAGDPTQDGLFTQEMVGGGYARKPVTFTTSSNKSVSNNTVVWWADLPDIPIQYIAVCTAISGGTMVAFQSIGTPVTIPEGQKFVLGLGDLAFSIT